MEKKSLKQVNVAIRRFIHWLDDFGETSYDFQSFYAGALSGRAKEFYYRIPVLGVLGVAPMIFLEAFVTSARQLFWRKQRFPIADAHYAMAFSLLSQALERRDYYQKALHFIEALEQTRCPGFRHYCWGYPFDWVTKYGVIRAGTPLITTTPYVYEALNEVYKIDKNAKWLEIMHSIAEHVLHDIKDIKTSSNASKCSYTPHGVFGVINASAYRAFLLTRASIQFSEEEYWQAAERNLYFVLESQKPNGSWPYSIDSRDDFIDHYHTCFVLKALAKIEHLTGGHEGCQKAIENGVRYYTQELFDEKNLPKPFSREPRLTVYRRELYNYAECINIAALLNNRFEELDRQATVALEDILSRWQKPDGSFRSRKLFFGWDNVPMHRWAQSQLFRSLCFLLHQEKQKVAAEKIE